MRQNAFHAILTQKPQKFAEIRGYTLIIMDLHGKISYLRVIALGKFNI